MTIDEFLEEFCALKEKGWRRADGANTIQVVKDTQWLCPILAVAEERGIRGRHGNGDFLVVGGLLGLSAEDAHRLASGADGVRGWARLSLEECFPR